MKEIKTKQELDEILGSGDNKMVLAKIYADWCQPCKVLGRTLLDIEGAYTDDYVFLEVNADEDEDTLIGRLGVYNLPTIVIFKGQDEIYRHSGLLTRAQITSLLDNFKEK